jgi:protein TonB
MWIVPGKKTSSSGAALAALLVPIAVGVLHGGPALAQGDRDVTPLVRITPDYPARALARDLEGEVVLEFTITAEGATKDIRVLESSDAIFEEPSIYALSRWRYSPPMIDGSAVEIVGVRTVITFALHDDLPPPQPGSPLIATPDEEE